jgi:hypothetical protein
MHKHVLIWPSLTSPVGFLPFQARYPCDWPDSKAVKAICYDHGINPSDFEWMNIEILSHVSLDYFADHD